MTKVTKHLISAVTLLLCIGFVIFSCAKLYIKQDFRQIYRGFNDSIHKNLYKEAFFKVHLKNGDVSLLSDWSLNAERDSILGNGKLFDFNRNELKEGPLVHNIDDIAIIETNQLEAIKSTDKDKISTLAVLTGVNLILDVACIANPKACFGSCPTFYTANSNSVHDAKAESFSSAISPALEKMDMDALNTQTGGGEFFLTMKNEAFETHMLNELVLTAIPKKSHEFVFHDRRYKFYKSDYTITPSSATVDGTDILCDISRMDDREFFSYTDKDDLTKKETIYLNFVGIQDQQQGLVINFRQSLLTTFLLYNGLSYMGDEVGDYFTKIETNTTVKNRLSNPFKLLGNIQLFVWDHNKDKWVFFDAIYETGPISKNLIIAPIPKTLAHNQEVKIKIELTKGLWRLDYLGLSAIREVSDVTKIRPSEVMEIQGVSGGLQRVLSDDENYLVSFPGNEFVFRFELPELRHQDAYELFLSSKGYYLEWIRANWLMDKNTSKLEKMLSNDPGTWKLLAKEYKVVEHQMERVFWNSKYGDIQ
ncbi:hypothetical protein [Seonamhaeicola aphaedonensis]|uniref:Uncharacterized protein n=1 Tax=Seonamhaeicola aphaedonensis TaxID=1461338 RepID=A0A3D9HM62_9FLAO|nr:hypothetical protein [Seonamhaeicola aphaedonensis]RED50568.1 hypothetical protein DFQ02_101602 [Seonamhaeicola aphaedonensis]